eukprot:7385700-Prymnesium_polylepis.2
MAPNQGPYRPCPVHVPRGASVRDETMDETHRITHRTQSVESTISPINIYTSVNRKNSKFHGTFLLLPEYCPLTSVVETRHSSLFHLSVVSRLMYIRRCRIVQLIGSTITEPINHQQLFQSLESWLPTNVWGVPRATQPDIETAETAMTA